MGKSKVKENNCQNIENTISILAIVVFVKFFVLKRYDYR
jgi:hypothetical protein